MNVTSQKLPKSQIKITVELTPEEWQKYREQAIRKISGEANLPGFRKGHIPEKVLIEKFGEQAIMAETIDIALPQTYMQTIQQEKVQPLAQPEVNIVKENPFTYEATLSVMPEVEVKAITKLGVKKKEIKVTKKEVDEMIEIFREQLAQKKEVDRKAKKGDTVVIDFQGFDQDGVARDGMQSKNHPIEIGSGSMIPGFEDELVGLKKDEEKSFQITFPKDYHVSNIAGKKFRFEVKVQAVEEKVLPEVNEAFVKNLTGTKKPVEELRTEIEDAIKARKANEQRQEQENALLEAVEKATKGDLPDLLIDEEVEYLIDTIKMEGLQQGITWENHLTHLKKTEDELKKDLREQAEKQVRTRLGIQGFLEKENITASKKDIEASVAARLSRLNEKDRAKQEPLFAPGNRGWVESEHRVRVHNWIASKLKELVK